MYEPLFIDMRGADWVSENEYVPKKDARRFEDWEFAYALVLGAKESIDYYLQINPDKIEKQIQYLSKYIKTGLQKIDGVTLHDRGSVLSSSTTFHLKGSSPDLIKNFLLQRKINVVSSPQNYALIDHAVKNVDWVMRVSPHYFNTIEEADQLIYWIQELSKTKY
jgi:selenocysteine lyase/cysteine desulfurase